jgi:FAD/FMN-containing dehydrogenase
MTGPQSDLVTAARTLATTLAGTVLVPGDEAYDGARKVWNAMHDRRPWVIARVRSAGDVAAAVRFGCEHHLRIAVRGGGHSVAGHGTVDGGLLIDLSLMRDIQVDAERRTAHVEPGATLADLDRATQRHGLVVPSGVISATGIAGLTLGGGIGWLSRPYGLTIDSLLGADVVTADSQLVHTSQEDEPDLLWGLRGGGGNFGIVTSFEFRTHQLGPILFAGNLIYHRPRWTQALRAFAAWTPDLPDGMTAIVSFITPPANWELGDETLMIIGFAWAGADAEVGARLIEPLRTGMPPDAEVVEPTEWVAWQSAADELFPKGVRAYWKNLSLDRLDETAIEALVHAAATMAPRPAGVDLHHLGGAVRRVPEDATAFPNRRSEYWVNFYAVWDSPEGDDAGRAWARDSYDALRPSAAAGEYVNFLGASPGDADASVAALSAYGAEKLNRLRALKRRWDPDNVFRLNHNIDPAD